MNSIIIQEIHQAIKGRRDAFRAVLERYKGLSYALAFRKVRRFPDAQRIAMLSWPKVAQRIRRLSNPEDFLGLLGRCVEDARLDYPAPLPETAPDEEHSIMKTAKVQARKALRQAFQAFDFPEAHLFFLRYVEGIDAQECAALLGLETTEAQFAINKSVAMLAYKAGFSGPELQAVDVNKFPREKLDILSANIDQAENRGVLTPAMDEALKQDPELRKGCEAVKEVVAQAGATFVAHRLSPNFSRETLALVVHPETAPIMMPRPTYSYTPPPVVTQTLPPSPGLIWNLVVPGMLIGGFLTGFFLLFLSGLPGSNTWFTAPGAYSEAGYYITIWGVGIAIVVLICPTFSAQKIRLPTIYYLLYGGLLGSLLLQLYFLSGIGGTSWMIQNISSIVGPCWLILCVVLLCYRFRWEHDLMRFWLEQRMKEFEIAVPTKPPENAAPVEPNSVSPAQDD